MIESSSRYLVLLAAVGLTSCLPAQVDEELETMLVISAEVDPNDASMTVIRYRPTRLVSTEISGREPAPLSSIRLSDEKVLVQGWVALLDASETEMKLLRERFMGKVRFEVEAPEGYHIFLKNGDSELKHPPMEGRYGERPATLNVELDVPVDESEDSIEVRLSATAAATGSVVHTTTESAAGDSPGLTITRTSIARQVWDPIEATLPVRVPATLEK